MKSPRTGKRRELRASPWVAAAAVILVALQGVGILDFTLEEFFLLMWLLKGTARDR